jgi:hypothetical protein
LIKTLNGNPPNSPNGNPPNSPGREGIKGIATTVSGGCAAAVCRKAGPTPGRKGARNQRTEMTARTVRGWCAAIEEDVGCHKQPARVFRLMSAPGAPPCRWRGLPLRRFIVETAAP